MLILKVTTFIVNEMQLKHEEEEVEYRQSRAARSGKKKSKKGGKKPKATAPVEEVCL